MDNTAIKTYGYRWIVLAVFAVLNAVVQINRITFAPITVDCMALYHTSAFRIVLLSGMYFCQVDLAVAQPFVMNAITKVSADRFTINERATATGVTMLAQFVGIIVAMALTKVIAQSYMAGDGTGRFTMEAVRGVLLLYGYASLAAGAFFIILGKGKPATPPCSLGGKK